MVIRNGHMVNKKCVKKASSCGNQKTIKKPQVVEIKPHILEGIEKIWNRG